MSSINKRDITETRLRDALRRLLDGCPLKTKKNGALTLNKINKEAGLGNSYIHKFPDFVEYVKPIINEYNASNTQINTEFAPDITNQEQLKNNLIKEKRLKEQYRRQRDNAKKAQAELEILNNTLMYRIFELQEELRDKNPDYIIDHFKTIKSGLD